MQLAVVATLALVALAFCGVDGQRPPRPGRGPPPFFFPDCQDFIDAVEVQKRENEQNGEGGPRACRNTDMAPQQCRFQDMLKARNQIPDQMPSEDCVNQVKNFFMGEGPSTETPSEA